MRMLSAATFTANFLQHSNKKCKCKFWSYACMHAANFLKLCILWIFYSYAHRFAMQQCRSKFSEPMHICNALVHMQIFWSLHAANFLQLCIPIPKTCICKFSRAMHICGLTICGQNGKYLKIFPVQQGIILLLLHLTKLANAKSDKEERLQILFRQIRRGF